VIHRYGSRKEREDNRIPFGIRVTTRTNGNVAGTETIDGKYRLVMTEEALEYVDTAGAGVRFSIPRGMLRDFSAEAVDE
jgi:hypothetical protein